MPQYLISPPVLASCQGRASGVVSSVCFCVANCANQEHLASLLLPELPPPCALLLPSQCPSMPRVTRVMTPPFESFFMAKDWVWIFTDPPFLSSQNVTGCWTRLCIQSPAASKFLNIIQFSSMKGGWCWVLPWRAFLRNFMSPLNTLHDTVNWLSFMIHHARLRGGSLIKRLTPALNPTSY